MLARRAFACAFLIGLGPLPFVAASPITFDFTGILNPSVSLPINGTYQISGSFTINSNPPAGPTTIPGNGIELTENGSNVSLTVNAGGQTFNFINTSQNPDIATFNAIVWPPGSPSNPTTGPFNEIQVAGSQQIGPKLTSFSMSFYNPGATTFFANPGSSAYVPGSSTFNFTVSTNSVVDAGGSGVFSSINAVPEPSTLIVFAVLGMTALVHGRRRARRAIGSRI